MFRFPVLFLACALTARAGIDLRLPTENHHLFTNEPDRFYMFVDRNFEGQKSTPWEGGSYGLVRTSLRFGDKIVQTKFHEGIDIQPIKRDAAGNPLDLVCAIAEGRVLHVSDAAGASNYGKYIVIAHPWENSEVVSLYAHLSKITVKPGDEVKAGSVLGQMGFTGAGIDRRRAHVHLELGIFMSDRYEDWHKATGKGVNKHGIFNGMNIAGADVAKFFLDQKANPQLTFARFLETYPPYFKVTVPAPREGLILLARYPWLKHGDLANPPSYEISFSATGMPLAVAPSVKQVPAPVVTAVKPSDIPHRLLTRGLITGQGNQATLTPGGKQLVALLTDDFPMAPVLPVHPAAVR